MTTTTPRSQTLVEECAQHLIETPFGYASISEGRSDDHQVVMTMTPEAARVIARIVQRGTTLFDSHPHDLVDDGTWTGITVDLLTSAALCGTPVESVLVSGYIAPKGTRP